MSGATLRHAGWILRGNPLTGIAAAGVFLLMLIAYLILVVGVLFRGI